MMSSRVLQAASISAKWGKSFFREQQDTVKGRTVVFQIDTAHPAIFADVVLPYV